MEVDFRIDQAVRGCTAGSIYTLREWAGLWGGGDQRYRVGQRLPDAASRPRPHGYLLACWWMTGAIPIRAATPAPQTASATIASAPLIADLRWVGTRLQRPLPWRLSQTAAICTSFTAIGVDLSQWLLDLLSGASQSLSAPPIHSRLSASMFSIPPAIP